jgi:G3E family GTPase
VRIGGLVAVVDGHAAATADLGHPAASASAIDLDAVAMADLVVVNRLERLVPALEQRTAWDLWSRNAAGQVHVDVPSSGADPLPARILGLAGFSLVPGQPALPGPAPATAPIPVPRHRERTLAGGDRPLRHTVLEVPGWLDREGLDAWVSELQDEAGVDLLRWRGVFALAGERRRWLGHGVRTTVEVDDGPMIGDDPVSRVELVGRVPEASVLSASLGARRA